MARKRTEYNSIFVAALAVICAAFLHGCSYSSETLLPEHIQTVYVDKAVNGIDITREISNKYAFQAYRPGLEVELRNALMNRIIYDGHLKIAGLDRADAVLKATLLEFRRDPLRYNENDTIRESRVSVEASFSFVDKKDDKVLWQTGRLAGNSDFFLSGPLAKTEDQVVSEALDDLSRHVVEAILEKW